MDIEGSFVHLIAFEKTVIKPITEWNYKQTSQWFNDIGYTDCGNLAKYHKIDGKSIAEANEEYLEDVLGITDIAKQQKLRYEINQVREPSYKNINLYGWGQNYFGQLGLLDKNINFPKKIPLPELSYKDDYILRFACGRRNTAILTKKGELWIAGNFRHDLNKKINKERRNSQESISDEEDKSESKKIKKEIMMAGGKNKHISKKLHGHKAKKDNIDEQFEYFMQVEENQKVKKNFKKTRHNQQKISKQIEKDREERKKVYDMEKSLEHRFINFTNIFTQNERGIPYRIENVFLGMNNFAAVMSFRNEPLTLKDSKVKSKKNVKLRPIEKILYKLEESNLHDVSDYTVVYEDRFEGNLEANMNVFLETSDIPTHRVRQVLKKGEIMWDRKQKIDNFKMY
jgi:uncharacterized protein (UPF0248 family)